MLLKAGVVKALILLISFSTTIILAFVWLFGKGQSQQSHSVAKSPKPAVSFICHSPDSGKENLIRERVAEAELIWKTSMKRSKEALEQYSYILPSPWHGSYMISTLDYLYPSYNCPHLIERIGQGGKWICGLRQLAATSGKCTIYSYEGKTTTTTDDSSNFEKEIQQRSNCTLRKFQHSITSQESLALMKNYPNLGSSSFVRPGTGLKKTGLPRSLKKEMSLNGDKFIDILKVDLAGGEFKFLEEIVHDFSDGKLPIGQLLLDIHLQVLTQEKLYQDLSDWMVRLDKVGLRAFHRDPNLYALYYGANDPVYFEFSFLNVGIDHRLLHA